MFSDDFFEILMKWEEEEIQRSLNTTNPFEYLEHKVKIELIQEIRKTYLDIKTR